MKVRYIGPGVPDGFYKTQDLTLGKEYDVISSWHNQEGVFQLEDDIGDEITGVIKGLNECPFEEYFELVDE